MNNSTKDASLLKKMSNPHFCFLYIFLISMSHLFSHLMHSQTVPVPATNPSPKPFLRTSTCSLLVCFSWSETLNSCSLPLHARQSKDTVEGIPDLVIHPFFVLFFFTSRGWWPVYGSYGVHHPPHCSLGFETCRFWHVQCPFQISDFVHDHFDAAA